MRWTAAAESAGDNLYRVELRAVIEPGWHVYDLGPYQDGPNPTVIAFKSDGGAVAEGDLQIFGTPVKIYDDIFEMEIGYFEKEARFVQQFRLTAPEATVTAAVEYMACNDQTCLPPRRRSLSFS